MFFFLLGARSDTHCCLFISLSFTDTQTSSKIRPGQPIGCQTMKPHPAVFVYYHLERPRSWSRPVQCARRSSPMAVVRRHVNCAVNRSAIDAVTIAVHVAKVCVIIVRSVDIRCRNVVGPPKSEFVMYAIKN